MQTARVALCQRQSRPRILLEIDEDPVDFEVALEALEVGELEVLPVGDSRSLTFPLGSKFWNQSDNGSVFDGVGHLTAFGECAEAVVVVAIELEVERVNGEESVMGCVLTDPVKSLKP